MQVTPVSAIPALLQRQRPAEAQMPRQENSTAAPWPFETDLELPHPASVTSRSLPPGPAAEYATQVIAGSQMDQETALERQRHVQHYAAATAYEEDERTGSISLSA